MDTLLWRHRIYPLSTMPSLLILGSSSHLNYLGEEKQALVDVLAFIYSLPDHFRVLPRRAFIRVELFILIKFSLGGEMARKLLRSGQVDKTEHRVHDVSWHGSTFKIFGHGFDEDTEDRVRPAAVMV